MISSRYGRLLIAAVAVTVVLAVLYHSCCDTAGNRFSNEFNEARSSLLNDNASQPAKDVKQGAVSNVPIPPIFARCNQCDLGLHQISNTTQLVEFPFCPLLQANVTHRLRAGGPFAGTPGATYWMHFSGDSIVRGVFLAGIAEAVERTSISGKVKQDLDARLMNGTTKEQLLTVGHRQRIVCCTEASMGLSDCAVSIDQTYDCNDAHLSELAQSTSADARAKANAPDATIYCLSVQWHEIGEVCTAQFANLPSDAMVPNSIVLNHGLHAVYKGFSATNQAFVAHLEANNNQLPNMDLDHTTWKAARHEFRQLLRTEAVLHERLISERHTSIIRVNVLATQAATLRTDRLYLRNEYIDQINMDLLATLSQLSPSVVLVDGNALTKPGRLRMNDGIHLDYNAATSVWHLLSSVALAEKAPFFSPDTFPLCDVSPVEE